MPSDITAPETLLPAPSTKDAILAKLTSLAGSTKSFVKENPELIAGTAAAGLGAAVGGKATGTPLGALTGAAVGGGLTAALSNILKNPSPGASDDTPVPTHSKKTGLANLAGLPLQHPVYAMGGTAAGLYGIRKFTPASVKDALSGTKDVSKEWPELKAILEGIQADTKLAPEQKALEIHKAMRPYLKSGFWKNVRRAATGEPEFWETLVKSLGKIRKR